MGLIRRIANLFRAAPAPLAAVVEDAPVVALMRDETTTADGSPGGGWAKRMGGTAYHANGSARMGGRRHNGV